MSTATADAILWYEDLVCLPFGSKVCSLSLVSPSRCSRCSVWSPHGRGRPQWGRTLTPQGPLAPQAGCEHSLSLPTLSLAVPTTQPKASTLRCGRVASLSRSRLPHTMDLIRPTASPLALCPTQLPHPSVQKSRFLHKKYLADSGIHLKRDTFMTSGT